MSDRLGIKTGTDAQVATQEKTEGGQNIHVQRFAQDWDALDFGGASPALDSVNVAGSESDLISCEGKSYILCKVEYSGNNVTAPFSIKLFDHNGSPAAAPTIKITSANNEDNTDTYETGYYHGELFYIPVVGFKNFKVRLEDAPSNSGSVSVWAKAV